MASGDPELDRRVDGIALALAGIGAEGADAAVVLGSGLAPFAERLEEARALPAEDVPGLPRGGVPGHAGRFLVGRVDGLRVLVQAGRSHLYEGHSSRDVSVAARAYARLGIGVLVLTNAAGGLSARLAPGTLLAITDHLNLQGSSPLTAREAGSGCPWTPALVEELVAVAAELDEPLATGVYAGLRGPAYETGAEVRHLARIGADAVGMSTVAEALAAHAEGLPVAGLSCITNLAAGLSAGRLVHEDVLAAGRAASERFTRLVVAALPRLSRRARVCSEQAANERTAALSSRPRGR